MLESKISEAGRGNFRVAPRELGQEINKMLDRGELTIAHAANSNLPDIFTLPEIPAAAVKARVAEILRLYGIFNRYASATGDIGRAGNEAIRRVFAASPNYKIICQRWGDVAAYDGIELNEQSDGLVLATMPLSGRPSSDAVAVVEIKNKREWYYAQHVDIWKLIRNAYLLDVVGIFFARRIARPTFGYTFKNVGALGVEMFAQFAPATLATELAPIRHKNGLGFHDITLHENPPASLQKRVDALAPRILVARDRMQKIRPLVEPFLDDLANPSVRDRRRDQIFDEMLEGIREHDKSDDEENDGDDPDAASEAARDFALGVELDEPVGDHDF